MSNTTILIFVALTLDVIILKKKKTLDVIDLFWCSDVWTKIQ